MQKLRKLFKSGIYPIQHKNMRLNFMQMIDDVKSEHVATQSKKIKLASLSPDITSAIPWLIDTLTSVQMEKLRKRIKTDDVIKMDFAGYLTVFNITCIEPGDYVRAIQEPQMLQTRVSKYDTKRKVVTSLPSFSEKWHSCCNFRRSLLNCKDVHEGKWELSHKYNYKLATNFMPMYARAIYDHFNAKRVLDSCAGWGDRLTGALCARSVQKYVGIDPNPYLRKGYTRILHDFGVSVDQEDNQSVQYSNAFKIHTTLFENSQSLLQDEVFDFALTSPPFFDFENYGSHMPKYSDWIEQFYKPLFKITHDHLEGHAFFVVYLSDTVSGPIVQFMVESVPTFTSFKMTGKIGMLGGSSSKIRDLYVFQRGARQIE